MGLRRDERGAAFWRALGVARRDERGAGAGRLELPDILGVVEKRQIARPAPSSGATSATTRSRIRARREDGAGQGRNLAERRRPARRKEPDLRHA